MPVPHRETLRHMLYEAAGLEHNLVCTYLHAAIGAKDGATEPVRRRWPWGWIAA